MELGFRIPMVSAIPDSLSCNFEFQHPGFQIPPDKIPEFRIAEANISRIPESGFPCLVKVLFIIGAQVVLP